MPTRVLHLIKSLGRGGAEMLLPEGLRFADRDRFEYHYGYFLPWKDAMVSAIAEQDAPVTCFGGKNNLEILARTLKVREYILANDIELLHCHMPIAGTVGRILSRWMGIPVVYSEHNLQERFHPVTRTLNKLTWQWQDHVIAVSGDVAESIRKTMGEDVPVQVVLNGVDVERFHRNGQSADLPSSISIPSGAPVVGTVAVFRTQKRLDDWLEAARLIRKEIPEARFLLVGDGPLKAEVESAIKVKGLRDVVFTPGLIEDVRPFLASMDVYMMSSIFEGLPVALLEAMAFECAPVCTSVGGIPELISDGSNGRLVAPQRPEELASAVIDVLKTDGLRNRLAQAGRQTVIDGFSMQRMTRELEDIYTQVLDERNHHQN
jgi:L-malate glycosyltransferase